MRRCIYGVLVLFASIGLHGQTDPGLVFNDITRTYGDEPFDLGASSSAGSGGAITYAITSGPDSVISISGDTASIHNAGTVTVRATIAASGDFSLAELSATVTVDRMDIEVRANDRTITYGFAYYTNDDYTILTALPYGDTKDDLDPHLSVYCTGTGQGTLYDAGKYTLRVRVDSEPDNYQVLLPTIDGTLTVNQKPIDFTINDAQRTYGEENPGFTGTSNKWVPGESFADLVPAPSIVCDATPRSDAGDYDIVLEPDHDDGWNYVLNVKPGTLTVSKASITLTANDMTVEYGDVEQAKANFSYTVDWLFDDKDPGDFITDPVLNTIAANTSGAGTAHAIYFQSKGEHRNYTIDTRNGILTIIKAALNVEVAHQYIPYKDPIPSLDTCGINVTGYKNGETYKVLLTSVVLDSTGGYGVHGTGLLRYDPSNYPVYGADAGTQYPIQLATTFYAINYEVYTNPLGILTVEKAPLEIVIHDINQLAGNVNPPLIHHVAPWKPGHTLDMSALDFDIYGYRVLSADHQVLDSADYQQPGSFIIDYPEDPVDINYDVTGIAGELNVYDSARFTPQDGNWWEMRACLGDRYSITLVADCPGKREFYWEIRQPGGGFEKLTDQIMQGLGITENGQGSLIIQRMQKHHENYKFRCTLTSSFLADSMAQVTDLISTRATTRDLYPDYFHQPYVTRVKNKDGIMLICRDATAHHYQWMLDDQALPGETKQYLDMSAYSGLPDAFTVATNWDTTGQCITMSGINTGDENGFVPPEGYSNLLESINISITPNPIHRGNEFTIAINDLTPRERYTIFFYDQMGNRSDVSFDQESSSPFVDKTEEDIVLDEISFPAGVNFVVVTQGHRRDVKAFIVHD